MAKLTRNASSNLTGRVDALVYRQTREGVVVARRPRPAKLKPRKKKQSAALEAQQELFRRAQKYRRSVLADPLARRAYERLGEERNRRFDRLLVSDYMTPPEIEHIELTGYQGRKGDVVRVLAWDDVEVVAVEVDIRTAAGKRVESGEARREHGVWNYTATTAAPAKEPLVITVLARDRPENEVTKKVMYP